ncbi:hypothetical protein ESZ53_12885 [Salinibacterium sp. UTAS2018]|uniref:hypothetical protein n=1 Tax=Salinibacterium sp. UTAS2018 TaxID=2508880 RepID=UPI001009645E|nr:hypothetical protein [Salinibacterium sp. UTAS2018]QAV71255.1 hypothetical protein ESZ53_12885 [Salinibacterium sp. UTAS2018]
MDNPGVFHSPTEGWAFIPFIGVLAALGFAVIAVLIWFAGSGYRLRAFVVTALAIGIGFASVTGLVGAADSFDERYALSFAKHSVAVKTWALEEYGLTLSSDDVADLVAGRPIAIDERGSDRNVVLQPVPGSSSVRLVGPAGIPLNFAR